MKNIYEVLRQKEQQSEQLDKEIDALRLTIQILDATEGVPTLGVPTLAKTEPRSNGNTTAHEAAPVASGNPTKRFP